MHALNVLPYENLAREAEGQLSLNFIKTLLSGSASLNDKDLDCLPERNINRRQINTAIETMGDCRSRLCPSCFRPVGVGYKNSKATV
jgi:hypothetical protein